MMNQKAILFPHPGPISGIPVEFWVNHEKNIGDFIKKEKLTAISKEARAGLVIPVLGSPAITMSEGQNQILWYGGNKAFHLHYKGDIFLLSQDQWNKFTQPILESFQRKLNAKNTVSFENMLNLSDVMSGMTESR